jgi:hypothetical protein
MTVATPPGVNSPSPTPITTVCVGNDGVAYRNLLMHLFHGSFPEPHVGAMASPCARNWHRDWQFVVCAFQWIVTPEKHDDDEIKEMWSHVAATCHKGFTDWMDDFVHHGRLGPNMASRYIALTK